MSTVSPGRRRTFTTLYALLAVALLVAAVIVADRLGYQFSPVSTLAVGFLVGHITGVNRGVGEAQRIIREAIAPVLAAAHGVRHMHDSVNEALTMLEVHPGVDLSIEEEGDER